MSLFEADCPGMFGLLQGSKNLADISFGKNVNRDQLLGGPLDATV